MDLEKLKIIYTYITKILAEYIGSLEDIFTSMQAHVGLTAV